MYMSAKIDVPYVVTYIYIIMYVLKTIIAVLDWDMTIKDAVNFPNFSLKNNIVLLENKKFDNGTKKYLLNLGHIIEEKKTQK